MSIPLQVLFVEDSIPDMEEMLYILRRDGFSPSWQRVDELQELKLALESQSWDVILCDHQLPGFDSLQALKALKQSSCDDTPFIIVSGVVDDDTAIIAMKAGASDFLKKDRLSRLGSAIRRELAELSSRRQHALTKSRLEESEERFRLMIDTARDYAIFMLDAEGRVISWNIGAERIFGYNPQEAMGLPLARLFPNSADYKGCSAEKALSIAAETGHYEEEGLRVRRDGTTFWVHAVMMPMLGADGSLQGFSRITRDIDKQKRADEAVIERNNFKNLFQQTSAVIAIVSGPDHILEFANPTLLRLLNTECVGKVLVGVCPELDAVKPFLDEVFSSGMPSEMKEFAFNGPRGQYFFDFVFSAKRNAQGLIDGVMLLGADVTEQLQARIAAEASSASKSAFLANMSHEIRTPLTSIMGFSDLLKDNTLPSHERDRYIDTINRNSHALGQIIDDILDLAKIEAGRLDIEEISFSIFELMNEVVELFKEKTRQKGIFLHLGFEPQVPPFICSDPTRLRQILFNIIGNAIKFTDSGGVTVSVRVKPSEGPLCLAVDVRDTGRGISDSQKAKLFQPFTQADNTTTRQFGGTGLGLALSKRLCEALGGTISIGETAVDQGSVFTITFLASRSAQNAEPVSVNAMHLAPDLAEQKLKNLRVLVIDDMIDNQVLLNRYLTRNGATVDFASDGSEGVAKAMNHTHDLVLMDIQMPKMDGYQAIKALQSKGYKKPIVALTAHALLEERRRTAAAGFAGHLTKPFNKDELINTVCQLARGSAAPDVH